MVNVKGLVSSAVAISMGAYVIKTAQGILPKDKEKKKINWRKI
jgi:hypothetical protein